MATRDLVVIGGSAGGVEALIQVVRGLPGGFRATVLVNLHMAARSPSLLPQILARGARVEVVTARDGLPLVPGQVVVGVPDRHLLVAGDHVELGRGAPENRHRPSHDAMLRSAALARGERVVGVVLSGMLDDGSAGLGEVARHGGRCVVQDPAGARFPEMPRHALAAVPDAKVVPLELMAGELARMTGLSCAPAS